jgi:hypothetical protein
MHRIEDDDERPSRREFLLSSGGLLTSAWLASHWPAIAQAAHHAEAAAAGAGAAAPAFEFFAAADGADVEAIAAQIVPSGATPGAREAHAAFFIDRALGSFFADRAADFRSGLAEFQTRFAATHGATFAAAAPALQIEFLQSVDTTPFFEAVRTLTIIGLFAASKYGGNAGGIGWRLIGFEDQHIFAAPFGHYDAEYTGFVPYGPGSAGAPVNKS